ncbi:DUF5993 family protein [Streptomyces sp. Ru73]|uniref:DUF5993 family protein n=1 Tax=Streptomyces sp. Ru73 TaxID=2080748 RepID=UPI0015E377D7|nr:DUF5993 family protein [Streptomyces sp. Ru73]
MDALLFAGLFATFLCIVGQKSRVAVVAVWSVMFASAVWLMAHHITGAVVLGLPH